MDIAAHAVLYLKYDDMPVCSCKSKPLQQYKSETNLWIHPYFNLYVVHFFRYSFEVGIWLIRRGILRQCTPLGVLSFDDV
jgi:hypothetical protein